MTTPLALWLDDAEAYESARSLIDDTPLGLQQPEPARNERLWAWEVAALLALLIAAWVALK